MSLTAVAFTGLPWADASGGAPPGSAGATAGRGSGKVCLRYDADDQAICVPRGPRGARGLVGRTGRLGQVGPVGIVGIQGPQGAQGAQGIQGVRGDTGDIGATGATGPTGLFGAAQTASEPTGQTGPTGSTGPGGAYPLGHTVVRLGTKVGPSSFLQGPATGTELQPSVARCDTSGANKEAFDGGAIITTSSPNSVVTLESSFPGLYVSQFQVDPLPLGATPGGESSTPANAYEAQAVVTRMQSTDNVTVQSYVVCGP
jgi:hypothetical protein